MNILRTNLFFKSERDIADVRIVVAPLRYKELQSFPYSMARRLFQVSEHMNLARVWFLLLSRKRNASILKQMTQNLVICSKQISRREEAVSCTFRGTALVQGVSATPTVFFNKVISLARLHTLFKSIVRSKFITVFHCNNVGIIKFL